MNTKEKFLQLLHSSDVTNVKLALEMAQGMPEMDVIPYLKGYQQLYECFFDEILQKISAEQIVQLNKPTLDFSASDPDAVMYDVV